METWHDLISTMCICECVHKSMGFLNVHMDEWATAEFKSLKILCGEEFNSLQKNIMKL